MNQIEIIDSKERKTPVKVTDAELEKMKTAGIRFVFIGKVEKPDVIKAKSEKE